MPLNNRMKYNIVYNKLKILKDSISNFLSREKYDLSYVVEFGDWSIRWDGIYITENLNKFGYLRARITTSYRDLKNQIIHFGSFNTFFTDKGFRKFHSSNRGVVTCFHIVPDDSRLEFMKKSGKYVDIFHTSANITKCKLIEKGISEGKIVVIPLGVDLKVFNPVDNEEKSSLRKEYGIPEHRLIIGSFQKDGVGWGEGLKPKLIKGPDIFVKTVEKLSKNYPIFVVLVGPARGFVKMELEKRNIPYKDFGYLKNSSEVAKYYDVLDLYLITSRIEGGPKQILEAWASGVPVVSTKVGMVPDITRDSENVLLVEVENFDQIANKAEQIIEDGTLKKKIILNGIEMVQDYSWEKITERYYKEIYLRLL